MCTALALLPAWWGGVVIRNDHCTSYILNALLLYSSQHGGRGGFGAKEVVAQGEGLHYEPTRIKIFALMLRQSSPLKLAAPDPNLHYACSCNKCTLTGTDFLDEVSGETTFIYDPGDSTGHTEPVESDGGYTNIIRINDNKHVGQKLMNTIILIVHRELVFELGTMNQGDHIHFETYTETHNN